MLNKILRAIILFNAITAPFVYQNNGPFWQLATTLLWCLTFASVSHDHMEKIAKEPK